MLEEKWSDLYEPTIYTLNARGYTMLEFMRAEFKLSDQIMHQEIQALHLDTVKALSEKDIPYEELKSALIPHAKRKEAAFIFDSQIIETNWYGYEIANLMLPLYDKRTTQSVLCGDIIGEDQDFIFDFLKESLVLARSAVYANNLWACVYVNNLSNAALEKFHKTLSEYPAYVGYIPCTFVSRARIYLSTILVNAFLKYKGIILMGHEDDRPNEENVNLLSYPFEEHGYTERSLRGYYFGIFLSYKIERPVGRGFEVDTEMSILAVSKDFFPLKEFVVEVDAAKPKHLQKPEKIGILKKAGIHDLNNVDLAQLILCKISAGYIYNLCRNQYDKETVVKFNLMVEVPRHDNGSPTRLVSVLEYKPLEKTLRLITLY